MKKYKDRIKGGKGDNKLPSDFPQGYLEKGIAVEMEHTDDPMLAEEIAIDHLTEFPNYYEELEKMEEKLKKQNPTINLDDLQSRNKSFRIKIYVLVCMYFTKYKQGDVETIYDYILKEMGYSTDNANERLRNFTSDKKNKTPNIYIKKEIFESLSDLHRSKIIQTTKESKINENDIFILIKNNKYIFSGFSSFKRMVKMYNIISPDEADEIINGLIRNSESADKNPDRYYLVESPHYSEVVEAISENEAIIKAIYKIFKRNKQIIINDTVYRRTPMNRRLAINEAINSNYFKVKLNPLKSGSSQETISGEYTNHFPTIPSDEEMEDWLKESIPVMVLGWILSSGITKTCSSISPAFASISDSFGIPMYVKKVPNHFFNIGISKNFVWKIDLSYCQFEIGTLSNEDDDIVDNYFLRLREISKNPYMASIIEKISIKSNDSILTDLIPPEKDRIEFLHDGTKSIDIYNHYKDKMNNIDEIRRIRGRTIGDLLSVFFTKPDFNAVYRKNPKGIIKQSNPTKGFIPPLEVAKEAELGLKLRKQYNRGGTDVGVHRAVQLKNRQNLSEKTINRMVSFFARHGVHEGMNLKENGEPTNHYIAWLLWGGDSGRNWANKIKGNIVKSNPKQNDEIFTFGQIYFNVTKAEKISNENEITTVKPDSRYSPLIRVDEEYSKGTDTNKPIIFATILIDGKENAILIDGHHRNRKAVSLNMEEIPAKVLSLKQTMMIIEKDSRGQIYSEMKKHFKEKKQNPTINLDDLQSRNKYLKKAGKSKNPVSPKIRSNKKLISEITKIVMNNLENEQIVDLDTAFQKFIKSQKKDKDFDSNLEMNKKLNMFHKNALEILEGREVFETYSNIYSVSGSKEKNDGGLISINYINKRDFNPFYSFVMFDDDHQVIEETIFAVEDEDRFRKHISKHFSVFEINRFFNEVKNYNKELV